MLSTALRAYASGLPSAARRRHCRLTRASASWTQSSAVPKSAVTRYAVATNADQRASTKARNASSYSAIGASVGRH